MHNFANDLWFKSSYTTREGQCVEVARARDAVGVRDSKQPHGGQLALTPNQWGAFMCGVKHGAYDVR